MNSISRETAIALAKDAGFKASIGQTVDDKYHPDRNAIGKSVPIEWVQRFYDLAVAHSRKDAEPIGKLVVWQHGDSGIGISFLIDNPEEKLKVNQLVYTSPPEADKPNPLEDLDCAKMMVRSAGYSLVSADFINSFAEFIQDWRKGDFDLPKLAALDVESCFDAWQKEVYQTEVEPILQSMELAPDVKAAITMCLAHYGNDPRVEPLRRLQAMERKPMTGEDMVNVVKAAGWPSDATTHQLVAAFNLIEATETFHKIAKAE